MHGRGLREEHCSLQRVLREHEAATETFQNREEQMQVKVEKLLVENSQLRAQLSEAKQKLESEVGTCSPVHAESSRSSIPRCVKL